MKSQYLDRGKRSIALNLLLLLMAILVWGAFIWYPSLQWRFWNPPSNAKLVQAQGTFVSREKVRCVAGQCEYPPYEFHTDSGKSIRISCEPSPPINDCLDEFIKRPSQVEIGYYTKGDGKNGVLAFARNDLFNITLKDRIKDIRSTTTGVMSAAGASHRMNSYSANRIRTSDSRLLFIDIPFTLLGILLWLRFIFNRPRRSL